IHKQIQKIQSILQRSSEREICVTPTLLDQVPRIPQYQTEEDMELIFYKLYKCLNFFGNNGHLIDRVKGDEISRVCGERFLEIVNILKLQVTGKEDKESLPVKITFITEKLNASNYSGQDGPLETSAIFRKYWIEQERSRITLEQVLSDLRAYNGYER